MMNAATLRRWAIVSSALVPLTAQAQEAPPPAAAEAQAAGDIIVTAQRREQRLQDVPVAVTAFSADQLKSNNVESVQDIATRTPGLSIGQVDPINQNFAMRGIGSASGISQNAGGDANRLFKQHHLTLFNKILAFFIGLHSLSFRHFSNSSFILHASFLNRLFAASHVLPRYLITKFTSPP